MSVSLPATSNSNNVWAPTSRGGQYVKQPYLVVSKDCHIKQKTIFGSRYIPSIQNTETGYLSVNGEVATPATGLGASTVISVTGTLTPLQLVSGFLICNCTAPIVLTVPTGATISTFIRSKFGGIILPGFGFDLRVKNVSAATTDTVTFTLTGIAGIVTQGNTLAINGGAELTYTFIYAGNIAGVETWYCY